MKKYTSRKLLKRRVTNMERGEVILVSNMSLLDAIRFMLDFHYLISEDYENKFQYFHAIKRFCHNILRC